MHFVCLYFCSYLLSFVNSMNLDEHPFRIYTFLFENMEILCELLLSTKYVQNTCICEQNLGKTLFYKSGRLSLTLTLTPFRCENNTIHQSCIWVCVYRHVERLKLSLTLQSFSRKVYFNWNLYQICCL